MYNLTKHIYGYDIGSMTGMATLNRLLTYDDANTKGCTKILVGPPYREPVCVDRIFNGTAAKSAQQWYSVNLRGTVILTYRHLILLWYYDA